MPCGTLGIVTCSTPRYLAISCASSQRKECAQRRHGARQRTAGEADAAAGRHEGAEALGIEEGKVGKARRMARSALSQNRNWRRSRS
jgi:hypothetical protein